MKNINLKNAVFLSLFIFLLPNCKTSVSAGDAKPIDFATQVGEVKSFWKAGKKQEYYVKALAIAEGIRVNSAKRNLNKAAGELFDDLISKEPAPQDVGTTDLQAMRKLTPVLTSSYNVSTEDYRSNARLLSRYLGKIRKEIIPNYTQKPVYLNVIPPAGVPMASAGMGAEGIKDPVLKAKYGATIQENQANKLINSQHTRGNQRKTYLRQ